MIFFPPSRSPQTLGCSRSMVYKLMLGDPAVSAGCLYRPQSRNSCAARSKRKRQRLIQQRHPGQTWPREATEKSSARYRRLARPVKRRHTTLRTGRAARWRYLSKPSYRAFTRLLQGVAKRRTTAMLQFLRTFFEQPELVAPAEIAASDPYQGQEAARQRAHPQGNQSDVAITSGTPCGNVAWLPS